MIAFGLMKALQDGNDSVSFQELRNLARTMQKRLNESDIDAVVIDTNLIDELCYFDRYFDFVTLNHTPYAKCKPGIGIQKLQELVGYLPISVRNVMVECMKG